MPGKNDKVKNFPDENIVFYNSIAQTYDAILEHEQSNKIIRQKVAENFCRVVKPGWIMDFGGGTGLDLTWLSENGYKILFCEPSSGMRQQAINYNNAILHNPHIIFLDSSKTDFKTWNDNPPTSEKLNGILSNFAVINNISEIELLFKNLAMLLNASGDLVALMLDKDFQKNRLKKLVNMMRSFVFQKPIKLYVSHKTNRQIVYAHSLNQIKKASKPYFNFCSKDSFPEFGFVLIHLTKK